MQLCPLGWVTEPAGRTCEEEEKKPRRQRKKVDRDDTDSFFIWVMVRLQTHTSYCTSEGIFSQCVWICKAAQKRECTKVIKNSHLQKKLTCSWEINEDDKQRLYRITQSNNDKNMVEGTYARYVKWRGKFVVMKMNWVMNGSKREVCVFVEAQLMCVFKGGGVERLGSGLNCIVIYFKCIYTIIYASR